MSPDYSIQLIGAFSTEIDMRNEFLQMNSALPAFYGDRETLNFLDITMELAPQVLVYTEDRKYKFLGYKPCKKILAILKKGESNET